MFSLKQIEGFYWSAELSGLERAARHLNTTQSAVSKRIQELEAAVGVPLFDRSWRRIRLTPAGQKLLPLAHEMLALRSRVLDLGKASLPEAQVFRIGVTELTAMTWLHALTERAKSLSPSVVLEPVVGASAELVAGVDEDRLDMAVVPDAFHNPTFHVLSLGSVEYAWMCRPGYVDDVRSMSLADLRDYTIIDQAHSSGLGEIIRRWLSERRVEITNTLPSSSLSAIAALTLAGHGISYLPRHMFEPMIAAGRLCIVDTKPRLPRVPYVVLGKRVREDESHASIMALIGDTADFSSGCVLF